MGRYVGTEAFAGIGVAGSIMNLFIFILNGGCNGMSIIFAELYGQKNYEKLRKESFLSLSAGGGFTIVLSIVSLLNGKLGELFTECCLTDAYLTKLYDYMVYFRENQDGLTAKNLLEKAEADLEKDKKSELLTKQQERIQKRVVSFFENASGLKSTSGSIGSESTGSDKTGSGSELAGGGSAAAESEIPSSNRNYEFVKVLFESETEAYENRTDEISFTLQNVFDFMEAAFGDSQEMVAFITELNANYYSLWFIRENGSDQYYRHNKGLLFDDRQKMLLGQMEEVENILNNGIK